MTTHDSPTLPHGVEPNSQETIKKSIHTLFPFSLSRPLRGLIGDGDRLDLDHGVRGVERADLDDGVGRIGRGEPFTAPLDDPIKMAHVG